ncbi:MAG: hypothetical protein RLZZ618_1058, partial [Pseudomonadota bacterium]
TLRRLRQDAQERLTVGIAHKDRLTPITPRSHVVDRARKFNAQRAGHLAKLGVEGAKGKA